MTSYISPTVKNHPDFKTLISNLARSDAQHDIGEINADREFEKEKISTVFFKGLPNTGNTIYNGGTNFKETGSICAVMGIDKETYYKFLSGLPDATSGSPTLQNNYFNTAQTNIPYTALKFTTNEIEGNNFLKNTGICNTARDVIFVVDFNQHHFLENLGKGDQDNTYRVHYVITPEVINDPAGKTNVNDQIFQNRSGGVILNSYVESGVSVDQYNAYSEYDENSPSYNNNFLS